MNRVTRGSVVLAAALVAMSCEGDPTGDLRNGVDHLVATPSALYVGNNQTATVLVEALDAQGNRLEAKFELGTVGAGISVVEDDSFNLVYNNKGELVKPSKWTRAQYEVTANQYVATSFEVSAGGESLTIPVYTAPASLISNVSNLTPALGDTVTIDAPAGLSFDPDSSVVTFAATATHLVARSATQISFVPPPGVAGQASVSKVSLDYAPAAGKFTVPTEQDLTIPVAPTVTAAPVGAVAIGDTITVTLPAPFKFVATSGITVGTGAQGVNTPVYVAAVSADSSTVQFLIGPGANDTIQVTGTRISGALTIGPYELTGATLSSPVVTNFPATFSTSTPGPSQVVTITAGAGYKFRPTATLAHGSAAGVSPVIISRAADSSAISFIAAPGGPAGPIFVDGVIVVPLYVLPISDLPTTASITPQAPYAGTDAFATAPVVTMPLSGNSTAFVDAGSFNGSSDCQNVNPGGWDCRIYQFTIGTAVTLNFSNTWNSTTDLGLYFDDAGHTDPFTHSCDSKGGGAGGQPEVCSVAFAPGTYTMQMTTYAPFYAAPNNINPAWFRIDVTAP
jgi:hypothetical protein